MKIFILILKSYDNMTFFFFFYSKKRIYFKITLIIYIFFIKHMKIENYDDYIIFN